MLHRLLRARSLSTAALLAVLAIAPAAVAVTAPPGAAGGGLVAVGAADPLRRQVAIAYDRVPDARRAAWVAFLQEASAAGGTGAASWHAAWDLDTGVPSRVFGAGLPAPGTAADPRAAEAHARSFLARHVALLAPGASPEDFALAANEVVRGQRIVAFTQTAVVAGRRVPVVGGQLSLRYRADRLFVLASEVAPHAAVRGPAITPEAARRAARAFTLGAHGRADASATDLVVLPLVRPGSVVARAAFRVRVEADAPRARYDAFVDAETGEVFATDQLLRFAAGEVQIDAPVRGPYDLRQLYAARFADVVVDGASGVATADGGVSFAGPGPASVVIGARGTFISVENFGGAAIASTLSVADGEKVPWSSAADELGDAQLSAYVHANVAKEHARGIAPEPLATWLDARMNVNVNRPDIYGCNAFWDGDALNFLRESGSCNNSARVSDVVYHEFGHGFHQHSAVKGAGTLDAAIGEGSGDFYAASITGDPLIAPGFFANGTALRALDGVLRWPDDISWDPHETGLIWGGVMWDLRVALQKSHGDAEGARIADVLFHAILGGASNIPATYVEALAADDDDGDLENGTPNVCDLNAAFAAHGLGHIMNAAGLVLEHDALALVPSGDAPYAVRVRAKTLFPQCAGAGIDDMFVPWARPVGLPGTAPLQADGKGAYAGEIPGQHGPTALNYHVTATVGGLEYLLPDNPADPEYQAFVGEVEPIYCNDFEHDADGWALGNGGSNDFAWGSPNGQGGDPPKAFSGTKVIGDRLDGDGLYRVGRKSSAMSPSIDVTGKSNLRLQFRRWLTVEDGALDQASITINDQPVWENAATDAESAGLEHVDREWRFVDLDLASYVPPGTTWIRIRFELKSGMRGQRGGWTIDDLCVVSAKKPPPAPPTGADAGVDGGDAATAPADAGESSGCAVAPVGGGRGGAVAMVIAGLALARQRRRARRRALAR